MCIGYQNVKIMKSLNNQTVYKIIIVNIKEKVYSISKKVIGYEINR